MAKSHAPRHGSTSVWPRKRAKRIIPRFRYVKKSDNVKPLEFYGYKVGMSHVIGILDKPITFPFGI